LRALALHVRAQRRASEMPNLPRGDVRLMQTEEAVEGEVVFGRSKTEAGAGRVVPLARRTAGALAACLRSLPETGPDIYVFPRQQVGYGPWGRRSVIVRSISGSVAELVEK